jgi:hypothetical protein
LNELSDADNALGHKRLFSVASLTETAKNAGLKIERMEGLFLKPVTTKQMQQLQFDESIYHALMKIGEAYPELSVGIFAHLKIWEGKIY